jgi:hypothetical protein
MIYHLATHGFIWHGHGVELEFGQFHVAIQNGSLFIGLSSSVGKIKLILVKLSRFLEGNNLWSIYIGLLIRN